MINNPWLPSQQLRSVCAEGHSPIDVGCDVILAPKHAKGISPSEVGMHGQSSQPTVCLQGLWVQETGPHLLCM
jgi:hypothetical protein